MYWNSNLWDEMGKIRNDMDFLLDREVDDESLSTFPLVNVYDNPDSFEVAAELPGMTKDQVNIVFTDDLLVLSGDRKTDDDLKGMTLLRSERSTGKFEKKIRISKQIEKEKITASFNNGVLLITLPKMEDAKPKTISINA